MNVAVGFDHAGFPLKESILGALRESDAVVLDMGTDSEDPVDFPVFAERVGRAVQIGDASRGILVCGSGIGACIAANKMRGVYASVCHDTFSAAQGVMHDGMNVLCLGARVLGPELAMALVRAFMQARYIGDKPGGERLARRVGMIHRLEENGELCDP